MSANLEEINISNTMDDADEPTTSQSYRYAESSFTHNTPTNFGNISMTVAPQSRLIKVNNLLQQEKHCKNSISTSKYNAITFLPKFLFEQFQKYSNIFFFMIVMLQQIPDVSPTGRYTTLVPLVFILGVSALKEVVEDFKRRNSDRMINNKKANVFRSNGLLSPIWQDIKWNKLVVGDVIKVCDGEQFPADLVLLASSEPNSIAYIKTSNLDGETNLKIRQAHVRTGSLVDSAHLKLLNAEIECELPNLRLYEFSGNLKVHDNLATPATPLPIGPDQILLRGSLLQNTKWIYGVVIYTGHETKLMMNSTRPPFKRSHVERTTNTQILLLFLLLLIISFISAVASAIWSNKNDARIWYIYFDESNSGLFGFAYTFLTFFILYNNLIPISLQVTLEMVKFFQAYFINWDEEMYDSENNFWAVARTSNLNEELGQIQYVFTDKTGTLTCNKMEFKRCSIAGINYGNGNVQEFNAYQLLSNLSSHETANVIDEFLTNIATCHTVIPEKKNNASDTVIDYQASSPDESALVKGVANFGIVFNSRQPDKIGVKFLDEEREYQLLNVLEFNSDRKRLSVILKDKTGTIKLYCKGADNMIVPRISLHPADFRDYTDATVDHMEEYAKEGFRTLVLAYRIISQTEYDDWNQRHYMKAASSIQNREKNIAEAAELIEKNLIILGATAIEDKLQEEVPETISMLKQAGMKVWILTGDKIETAVNIGYSCKLIDQNTSLIYLTDDRAAKLKDSIRYHLNSIANRKYKETEIGLILDGKVLHHALSLDLQGSFLDLLVACKTVICCRATPKNKAEIVEFVKLSTKSVTLAIGDGANDISMIQAAHVGIGIYGREGTQAVSASDYAIGKFRFLARLLFVHGIWNYKRLCKVILYSFYKNICLYVIELWFAMSNGFSGQIIFERWLISFYNVLFTAGPPLALGLFDRPNKASTMLRFPQLYKITQNKSDFNLTVFWTWIFHSFIHSVLIYFICYGIFKHEVVFKDGQTGDYLFMGTHVYTYCVVVVCLKSGLETDSWTWLTHLSIWGSIGFWLVFLAIYSEIWPLFGVSPEMFLMFQNVVRTPVFWLGLILVPIMVLLPDIVYKVVQRSVYKTDAQAIQESEIKNQDVEPLINMSKKLTETARLLRGAFRFTRVPSAANQPNLADGTQRYRGYAFSQEENGAITQADLIRTYNSKDDKPSGN